MNGRRLSVAVVQGGPSTEAEVSRASAKSVAEALKGAGHAAVRFELDGHLAESIRTGAFDVVFPVAHGAVGEDGSLQGLLEVLDIPYVGSGVLASAVAMNKELAREIFALRGLPVARGLTFKRGETSADVAAERARAGVGLRLVVKPCSNGSAIGVARIEESEDDSVIARAIEEVWTIDDVAVVEHFARGREVTCGVLDAGEKGLRALPPTEIASPNDAFYTYEARYAPGRSVHTCPAPFEPALNEEIQRIACLAHKALGCRDLSRVDFVIGDDGDEGKVTLLEVNTMPGFTRTSLYPEAAGVAGVTVEALCDLFVRSAYGRGATRRAAARALPG